MNKSGTDNKFTIDGAAGANNGDGRYIETRTGYGLVTSDEELEQKGLEIERVLAQGRGGMWKAQGPIYYHRQTERYRSWTFLRNGSHQQ